jgi:hypothetical protein
MSGEHARIAEMAATKAVEEVLEKLNLTKEYITLKEIRTLYGRKVAKSARISEMIEWFPMEVQGGSSVYCKKSEFTNFLFNNKF